MYQKALACTQHITLVVLHRDKTTLADLEKTLGGDRRISLCRELTKLNEEAFRTTLSGAVEYYDSHEPRGEYVLVVEGGTKKRSEVDADSNMTAEEYIAYFIGEGMSKNDAIKATAKKLGIPRNEVYKLTIDN